MSPAAAAEKVSPDPDLNSPEGLARATAELRALGIDDDVVFVARTPDELIAFLDATEPVPCASST